MKKLKGVLPFILIIMLIVLYSREIVLKKSAVSKIEILDELSQAYDIFIDSANNATSEKIYNTKRLIDSLEKEIDLKNENIN